MLRYNSLIYMVWLLALYVVRSQGCLGPKKALLAAGFVANAP